MAELLAREWNYERGITRPVAIALPAVPALAQHNHPNKEENFRV
jgi:hypothetical protein